MARPYLMLFGFLFLWHEIAIYFRMDANTACAMTGVVFAWHYVIHAWAGELLGQSRYVTATFFEHGLSWIALFCWLTPPVVADIPISLDLVGWAVLALIGAQARLFFDHHGLALDKRFFRDRQREVMLALIAFCGAAFLSRRHMGSVLPFFGYLLLIALPLRFGWLVALAPAVQTQFNAAFGSQAMFEDENLSEEI